MKARAVMMDPNMLRTVLTAAQEGAATLGPYAAPALSFAASVVAK